MPSDPRSRARNLEAVLGVPVRERVRDAVAAVRDRAEAAPLEIVAHREDLFERGERLRVALVAHDAAVLVFDLGAAGAKLAEQERDGLEDVGRLEAGDDDRAVSTRWR